MPSRSGRQVKDSFQNPPAHEPFVKFNPMSSSPDMPGYCLHPLRDDVPIVDPCTGFMSPAAEAELRRVTGWTSPVKAIPQVAHGPSTSFTQTFRLQKNDSSCLKEDLVRKFMYTTSTQRAFEDVPWDMKLPAKLQPPETTIEKMPDQVSQRFTLKRYESQPEIWQVASGMWDRFQTRMFHGHKKPKDFISPYPRMDHIPGYCGFTGSTNSEDIDNPNTDYFSFTKVRNMEPQYTNTAHTPNIPGYTGRVYWIAIHPAHSKDPSYLLPSDTNINRSFPGSRIGTAFKHRGPLSRMVTTVSPYNPFTKVEKEIVK
ncbi:hypothetical protein GDO81_012001 [Engystomops pustulosus]|uniref:Spermatogenesis-associated protein 48 n=1 Tax=Engystomops pustulosus TaxID=76066 RepID=A0AAV7BI28_ENGPU|nr:hypothetical protein GDO81_012001 [Engystomops pustulosus]